MPEGSSGPVLSYHRRRASVRAAIVGLLLVALFLLPPVHLHAGLRASPPARSTGAVAEARASSAGQPSVAAPNWFNVTAAQKFAPAPMVGSSVVYDPADNELVMFGGCASASCPAAPQTWVYAGGFWTDITSMSSQPPARAYAGFTYDSRDGYALLFGGRGTGGTLNDTWAFSGGSWTNLTNRSAPAPSPRWSSGLAFDRLDDYAVLFGGATSGGTPLNDTWHFLGGVWKNVTASLTPAPGGRFGASFSYDSGDGYVLLIGGCASTCPLADSWQFVRGHWAALAPPTSPPARAFATLTYDAVQNTTFYFGGNDSSGPRSDTWRYAGGKWANVTTTLGPGPTARLGAAAVQCTVATAGSTVRKWTFDFYFGGSTGPGPWSPATATGQTWVIEPPPSTTASVIPSLVEVGQVATFASAGTGGSPPYVYLWQFGDGVSSLLQNPTHVYPQSGPYTPSVTVSDWAGVSARSTTSITVVSGPAVSITLATPVTDVGRPVAFSSVVSGGSPPYLYHWSFGDTATATGAATSHPYTGTGTFTVNLTVTDTVQGLGVRFADVTVHPVPSLTTTASTGTPWVGSAVNFTVSVAGGTGPFRYLWSFGDGAQSTSPGATHTYQTPGTYPVTVEVTDTAGSSVWQNFSIRAATAPDSGPTPDRWLGLTDAQWGFGLLALGALVAVAGLVYIALHHRRRPPGSPIAAAAVGQPGWGSEEELGGPSASSRSFRRSQRR